jgi:ketopantoate hydroxymethyltransferase
VGIFNDCDIFLPNLAGIHSSTMVFTPQPSNPPKFVKNFLTSGSIISATSDFIQAVKNQTFPTDKHSY